jgi:hypothetical protein
MFHIGEPLNESTNTPWSQFFFTKLVYVELGHLMSTDSSLGLMSECAGESRSGHRITRMIGHDSQNPVTTNL